MPSGAHGDQGNGCPGNESYGYLLGGTVTGLVGYGLTLHTDSNPSTASMSVGSNGPALLGSVNCNTAWDLTVHTQPTNPPQTCVVTNGSGPGGTTSNVDNIAVTCTTNPPRFAYVVNRASNNVSAYSVDAATGALTPLAGSPLSTVGNCDQRLAQALSGARARSPTRMHSSSQPLRVRNLIGLDSTESKCKDAIADIDDPARH